MKKISTRTAQAFRKIQKLTIGLDLGDRSSWYCVPDERGAAVLEQSLSTTPKAMQEVFGACRGAGNAQTKAEEEHRKTNNTIRCTNLELRIPSASFISPSRWLSASRVRDRKCPPPPQPSPFGHIANAVKNGGQLIADQDRSGSR